MWLASYVATLAKNTAWTHAFILWELSYLAGLQLEHSYLRAMDVWTIPVQPPKPPVTDAGVDDLLKEEPDEDLDGYL